MPHGIFFQSYAFITDSIHIAPQEYYVPPMPERQKIHGKSLFFLRELGNGRYVDSLLNKKLGCSASMVDLAWHLICSIVHM